MIRVYRLSPAQRLRLELSRVAPVLFAAWLVLFLMVQSDHILPGMFLIHTFGTEVLIQFNALMDPDAAAALSMPHALLTCIVAVVCMRLLRNSAWTREDADACEADVTIDKYLIKSTMVIIVLAVAIGIPLTGIVVRAERRSNVVLA